MNGSLDAQTIQNFIPFDELSSATIEELLPHFQVKQFPAKKMLFKRGQQDLNCHFLLQGSIELADESFNITRINADDDDNILALDNTHQIHRCAGITQSDCVIASIPHRYLDLVTTWAESRQALTDSDENDWLKLCSLRSYFIAFHPPIFKNYSPVSANAP